MSDAGRCASQQLVTDSTNRLEHRSAGQRADLAAQAAHIDVNQVGIDVEVRVPDFFCDKRARENATCILHKTLRRCVFAESFSVRA